MVSSIILAVLTLLDGAGASKSVRFDAARAGKYGAGYVREGTELVCSLKEGEKRAGACWSLRLDQKVASPVRITAQAKTEAGDGRGEVLLYVDVSYVDGGHLWGQRGFFPATPGDWQTSLVMLVPSAPIRSLSIYEMVRQNTALRARFRPPVLECLDVPSGTCSFDGTPVVAADPIAQPTFFLRDWKARSGFEPIDGTCRGTRLDVTRTSRGAALFQELALADTTGEDRALTLAWALPIGSSDVTWFSTPRSQSSLNAASGERRTLVGAPCGAGGFSRWPIIAVEAGGRGQAIGLDPRLPGFFRLAVNPSLKVLTIAFDLALAKESPSARVGFVTFPFEAKDGFRGALAAYQALFPEFNEVRQKKQGNWMAFHPISKVERWEDFGFAIKEGDGEVAWDDAHGITTYRYTEPTTWWMPIKGREGRKYATMDECLARAEELARADYKGRDRGYARSWKACAIRNAAGLCSGRILDTPWCNGIVWNMNSAPGQGPDGEFNAKYPDSHFEKKYRGEFPAGLDGEYVDSAEMYVTDALDYNRANFAGMKTPLVFSCTDCRPCVFKGLMGYEYVRGVWERVRAKGRRTMANGTPGKWCWLAPYLDVMGTETNWMPSEGKWQPSSDDHLMYARALCGGKPYCFLMNTDFDSFTSEMVEKYMQHALAYGMYPSFFSPAATSKSHYFAKKERYERDRPLFVKYLPLCRRVGEAGWRPVNRLLPIDPKTGVLAEQFGSRYVTLFNPSQKETRTVSVPAVQELVTGRRVTGALDLPPETCRVLDFN